MTDTQNEVFKTPVNKIRLFEHGAPGSQNLKLTRKYYTEDMPDGRVKHIVQNITDPESFVCLYCYQYHQVYKEQYPDL